MTAIKTYDPAAVRLSVAGILLAGFAPGQFITFAPDAPPITDAYGVDGEPARWQTGNPFANLDFQLMHTSPSNVVLSNLANVDLLTQAGIFPVVLEDKSNPDDSQPTRLIAGRAWIQSWPTISYGGGGPSARGWRVRCLDMITDIRGQGAANTTSA